MMTSRLAGTHPSAGHCVRKLFAWLLLFLQGTLLFQGSISAISERDALIDFYDATNGDLWVVNLDWKSENEIDDWAFVTATGGDKDVVQIDVEGNNLQGEEIITLDI
jgi:hypothetical protein